MNWAFDNWMLVFVRATAFFSILPIFTMLNAPVQLRVAMAALLAMLVAPTLPPFSLANFSIIDLIGLFIKEVLSGLLIGFVTRMIFYATDFAGTLISNEIGLNLASVFDPANARPTQAPGMVMFLLTAVLMMSLDMHHWLLTGFQYTYTLLPVGSAHLREELFGNIVNQTSGVFLVGFQIAAPLIAASFLALMLLGFLGRLVPQMNVFAESFTVRIACGLTVFALTLEISAQHIINGLHRLPEDMMRVSQLLGPD
jgi:flagellar biosynthetic protein FliR